MIELNAGTFHDAMATWASVACVLHCGAFAPCAPAVQALRGAEDGLWTWARIDLAEAPGVADVFAIAGGEPHLLLMREAVVLYCAPVPAAEAGRRILERAGALDMTAVMAEIAQERAGRASLFARRVCPTAWRTR